MDRILLLQRQLNDIQHKLNEYEHQHICNDDTYLLFKQKRKLQRELLLEKGEETAVLLDYPFLWDTGAPLPRVISNGYKTFLMYYIGENDPAWKAQAQTHEINDLKTGHDDIIALVEFNHCYCYRFGGINEEVISGHPLFEHGLEAYAAHIIENSKWIQEQSKINAVHKNYSQALWDKRKHYVFTFHDEIFECIADGYKVEVFKGKMKTVYDEATKRLFD